MSRMVNVRLFVGLLLVLVLLLFHHPRGLAQTPEWNDQFGERGVDEASSVAVDDSGNVYVAGTTDGDLGGSNKGGLDAFLIKYDASGSQVWIAHVGSDGDDVAHGVGVDDAGAIFVAGETTGALGDQTFGLGDAWVARFDDAGSLEWVRQFGTPGDDAAHGIGVNLDDATLLVAGSTDGLLGGTHFGGTDAFLACLEGSDGTDRWIEQLGTREFDEARAVTVSDTGAIYVAGNTDGLLAGVDETLDRDAWLARYDRAGNQEWARQQGTTAVDEAFGVAVAGTGDVYITGRTSGSLGGANAGGTDVWTSKYREDGLRDWTRQLGTVADDCALGAAADDIGRGYVVGWTDGPLGGPSNGAREAFAAQYDRVGNLRWTRLIGRADDDEARGVAVDDARYYYLAGTTENDLMGAFRGGVDGWVEATSQAPEIASFTPGSGATGTVVTIDGKNFVGVTGVSFNGASASYVVDSAWSIRATLPAPATTGRISVTTADGVATSPTDFVVTTTPAVAISASPTHVYVRRGQTTTTAITLARSNYSGPVSLSVRGAWFGISAGFTTNPVNGNTSVLVIETFPTSPLTTRTLSIGARAPGIPSVSVPVQVTIVP
jgi:hypothetical protein